MKLTSKNLYSYCDNNPASKTDSNGEIAIAAIAGSVALNVGTYVLSTAMLNAAGVQGAELSANGIAGAVVSGIATGISAGAGMMGILFATTVDCVYAAMSTYYDTGNLGYAIFSGMSSAAFSLGSLPGMMSLLDIEDYIPVAERTMLKAYVGTTNNAIMSYIMSGTSNRGQSNSRINGNNVNKSNWPIVQPTKDSKEFDMTSILLPTTLKQMQDFHKMMTAL